MPNYTDEQKQQWAEQRQQQLSAITDLLEQGVSEVFTSEKYMEYLKTMSKFTRYSTNNTILISMQRPDATLVAGYESRIEAECERPSCTRGFFPLTCSCGIGVHDA